MRPAPRQSLHLRPVASRSSSSFECLKLLCKLQLADIWQAASTSCSHRPVSAWQNSETRRQWPRSGVKKLRQRKRPRVQSRHPGCHAVPLHFVLKDVQIPRLTTSETLWLRQDTTWERPTLLPDGTVQFFPTEDACHLNRLKPCYPHGLCHGPESQQFFHDSSCFFFRGINRRIDFSAIPSTLLISLAGFFTNRILVINNKPQKKITHVDNETTGFQLELEVLMHPNEGNSAMWGWRSACTSRLGHSDEILNLRVVHVHQAAWLFSWLTYYTNITNP